MPSTVRTLRLVGIAEGLSFLILLFVAMPLKYFLAMPLAVRVVGMIHGALFLALIAVLHHTTGERDWPAKSWLRVLVAALLPFGFLAVDPFLRNEIARETSTD